MNPFVGDSLTVWEVNGGDLVLVDKDGYRYGCTRESLFLLMQSANKQLRDTIEAEGGVERHENDVLTPVGCAKWWPALAAAYITACTAAGVEPMEEDDDDDWEEDEFDEEDDWDEEEPWDDDYEEDEEDWDDEDEDLDEDEEW